MLKVERPQVCDTDSLPEEPGCPGQPPSLHARLKFATRFLHEDVERITSIAASGLTLPEYKRILARFYGFYQPWERQLTRLLLPEFSSFFSGRHKVPKLETDLAWLGLDPNPIELCACLPPLATSWQALGSCYVAEGATLGGQLISRHLETTLGFSNGCGYSFFRGYGPYTGSRWREFISLLESAATSSSQEKIIQGAQNTFRSLHSWLGPVSR